MLCLSNTLNHFLEKKKKLSLNSNPTYFLQEIGWVEFNGPVHTIKVTSPNHTFPGKALSSKWLPSTCAMSIKIILESSCFDNLDDIQDGQFFEKAIEIIRCHADSWYSLPLQTV